VPVERPQTRNGRNLLLGFSIALAVLLPGSRPAQAKAIHLALPDELKTKTDDLEVTQRRRRVLPKRPADKAVVFGPFRVDQYRAGWTEKTVYGIGSRSLQKYTEKSWRRYSFELRTAEGGHLPVECIQRKEERGLRVLGENSQTDLDVPWGEELRCSLYPGDGVVWELAVSGGRGTFTGPESAAFDVRASNRAEGTSFRLPTPVGFLFERDGKSLGAVEVLNKGRFLLSQNLPSWLRPLVAGAASALLLADSLE